MASHDKNSAGSITRRNLVAATTVVIGALASRTARASSMTAGVNNLMHGAHCYLRGTAIRTPSGEREISELQRGDLVVTYSGQPKPIKWIGRRRLQRDGDKWSAEMTPVKLMPSALGDDIPHRELSMSRYHAVYLDGQLIPVGSLVNGRTIIVPRTLPEVLEYFHIELFEPDVIYAEGAPTETFQPFESRRTFDNWQEYADLYGSEQAVTHPPFAPAIPALGARFLVRSRLRSAVSPWWDVRTPFDIARDRIETRAQRLSAAS